MKCQGHHRKVRWWWWYKCWWCRRCWVWMSDRMWLLMWYRWWCWWWWWYSSSNYKSMLLTRCSKTVERSATYSKRYIHHIMRLWERIDSLDVTSFLIQVIATTPSYMSWIDISLQLLLLVECVLVMMLMIDEFDDRWVFW